MYSNKRVGPKKEPRGTSVLARHSCEDFPSRTTRDYPSLRIKEIRFQTSQRSLIYRVALVAPVMLEL